MKKITLHWRRIALAAMLASALLFTAAQAQSGGFSLDWWTVDSGGGVASGGDFTLEGSIGQPDAGAASGGDFTLTSGFQAASSREGFAIYLPLLRR